MRFFGITTEYFPTNFFIYQYKSSIIYVVCVVQTYTHTRATALRRVHESAGATIHFHRAVERDRDITASPTPRQRSTFLPLEEFSSQKVRNTVRVALLHKNKHLF